MLNTCIEQRDRKHLGHNLAFTGPDLRRTQVYTSGCGSRVAALHLEAKASWQAITLADPARCATFSELPSVEELRATMMDPWHDAGLDEVVDFIHKRLMRRQLFGLVSVLRGGHRSMQKKRRGLVDPQAARDHAADQQAELVRSRAETQLWLFATPFGTPGRIGNGFSTTLSLLSARKHCKPGVAAKQQGSHCWQQAPLAAGGGLRPCLIIASAG